MRLFEFNHIMSFLKNCGLTFYFVAWFYKSRNSKNLKLSKVYIAGDKNVV